MHYERWKRWGDPNKTVNNNSPTLEGRLWDRIDKGEPDDCWPWTGQVDKDGYGKISFKNKSTRTHVAMFTVVNGFRPELVRHTCDNPPCCNPGHLLEGTHKSNAEDKVARGRGVWPIGSKNGMAKLDEAKVAEMRRLYAEGWTVEALAVRYITGSSTIRGIIDRRAWKHVP